MKVLFVNIGELIEEPLGLLYISAALKSHGHECDLIFGREKDILEKAVAYRPDIIAYSLTTGLHTKYSLLNKKLKEKIPFLAIAGGPHPTFFPEIIEKDCGIDGVCVGEGEEASCEFVDLYAQGKDITNVPNWWVKDENGIVHRNHVRNLTKNLDMLSFPDRDLFYLKDKYFYNSKMKWFMASRGCPFNCSYCFNKGYRDIYHGKGEPVRFRSVDNLVSEILSVKQRYPLEFVSFVDDIFIINLKWLKIFSEIYPKAVGLPFFCTVRPDLVTEDVCLMLKKSGCYSVELGIEAGNDRLRKEILNRNMGKDTIINAARLLKKYKIKIYATNIIGLPGENIGTSLETLDLNIKCAVDFAWVSLYQPYPKTMGGDYCIRTGLFDGDYSKLDPTFHLSASMIKDPIDRQKIENLHDFFLLGVTLPKTRSLIKILITFPRNFIYSLFYKLLFGFLIKKRLIPYRLSFWDTMRSVKKFWCSINVPSVLQK